MNRTKENGPARRDGMPGEKNAPEAENRAAPIGPEEVREAEKILADYRRAKANLDSRVTDNEQWFLLRHWEQLRKPEDRQIHHSAWLFNSIVNKHADFMDATPECTVLVFKDSFGSPLSAFLGLAASNVYSVDLRSTKVPMEQWVELVQPDVVVFAYSEQTFRNVEVEIGEQELKSE